MSRRENGHLRCDRCRMLGALCVCALIPRIETTTRLVLVIHRREVRKTTNTGQLAAACLVNREVVVRGHEDKPSAPIVPAPGSQLVLLFPHEDATPLDRFAPSQPVTLVVPDGTWRQGAKVRARVPGLRDVPCVTLPRGTQSAYRLRFDAHEEGLATMEAIARALGRLEGERGPDVQGALEHVFQVMVERTLWSRGVLDAAHVTGGIPVGAVQHDPRITSRDQRA